MATKIDICNMALAYLGDRATVVSIDPPEGSPQADHCARFYPIAKGQILAEHPWSFALKRANRARLADAPEGARYAYTLPRDCVRVVSIFDARSDFELHDYTLESDQGYVIVTCDSEDVYINYVSSLTPEVMFSASFADALAHLLASKLAGAVMPGTTGIKLAQEELKLYLAFVEKAVNHDAVQTHERELYKCPFVGDMTLGKFYGYN